MNKCFLFLSCLLFFLSAECKSQVIQRYPFGCSILVTHKFPPHWEASDESNDSIKKPHEVDFFHTSAYYEVMSRAKTFSPPPIEHVEYIKIGDGLACTCTNSLPFDSCRYKLANIGNYEVYYICDDVYENTTFEKSCPANSCLLYGDLILYDSSTHSAKVLLIYFEGSSGSGNVKGTPFRYFYITKEKSIELYDGFCNDAGCEMQNNYSIHVLSTGEIEIKENTN